MRPVLLERLTEAVKEDNQNTLIIAGDLTCSAAKYEYEVVSEWLRDLYAGGVRIILAPGNHDTSQSILITRIRLQKGFERFAKLADFISEQPMVVARRDDFDMIYKIDKDVFFAARSTHHRLRNPTRVRKKQYVWAMKVLIGEGLIPAQGYRLHLVTHQSLWCLPPQDDFEGDKHNHMHKRKRLREMFLEPLGFSTAINGHNHNFTHGVRPIKEGDEFQLYQVQAPTLSEHKARKRDYTPGFVKWDPSVTESARLETGSIE